MRVTKYIKMVAESLIHDLSINWDDGDSALQKQFSGEMRKFTAKTIINH